jgi:hypothetical protein
MEKYVRYETNALRGKMTSSFSVPYDWHWQTWHDMATQNVQDRKMYWFATTLSYKLTKIFQTHDRGTSKWLRKDLDNGW